jgi:hypothetical protein
MSTDARISSALATIIHGIEVPPAPLRDILRRSEQPQSLPQQTPPYFRIAIAAMAALIIIAIPFRSPGLVQSVEARIAAILQWTPPPPPPKSVTSAMRSQTATLAAAQARVPFTIAAPAGLPNDVKSETIVTTPTAIYYKTTHSWRVGTPAIDFVYHRAGGRSFSLMADQLDARTGPQPKYVFDADSLTVRGGHVALVKHENFAWSNGNQVMTVIADGISVREIEAIRVAMRGVPLPLAQTRAALNSGTIVKQYRITVTAP